MKKLVFILVILSAIAFLAFQAEAVMFISGTSATGAITPDPTDQLSGALVQSVGIDGTSLASDGTIDIASNIATFSSYTNATFPTNIGVGDAIAWNDGTDRYAVIKGLSVDANGAKAYVTLKDGSSAPIAASSASYNVYRQYLSVDLADTNTAGNANIAASHELTDKDLTDADDESGPLYFAAYADGIDTDIAGINGWTTDADDFIQLYTPVDSASVGVSQRHSGTLVAGTTAFRMDNANSPLLDLRDDFIRIVGIQAAISGTITGPIILMSAGINPGAQIRISHNILDGDTGGSSSGVQISETVTVDIYNNIISGDAVLYRSGIVSTAGTTNAYNNTIVGTDFGIRNLGGVMNAWMNLVTDGGANDNFAGTINAGDYNACEDAECAGGANDLVSQTRGTEFDFVNYAGGNYHLTASYDGTTDQSSGLVTDDIDGESRSGTFDIGGDEYVP